MAEDYSGSTSGNVYKKAVSVDSVDLPGSDISRVLPRQMSTGTMRGTQTVGYGNTKIDGSNNRITVGDTISLDGDSGQITVTQPDGTTLGMGIIPGFPEESGFFSLDSSGRLVMKIIGGTKTVYDPANNYIDITLDGLLPDGTGGFVAARPGTSAEGLFA